MMEVTPAFQLALAAALPYIGSALAVIGSVISLYGACMNNLYHRHKTAMVVWAFSNILLLIWAVGYTLQWWDGAIAGMALVMLYGIYSITNFYGLYYAGRS